MVVETRGPPSYPLELLPSAPFFPVPPPSTRGFLPTYRVTENVSIPIEFGSLDRANDVRDRYGEHLCPADDNRSMKTVFFVSDAPEGVIEAAEAEAADSKAADTRSNTEELTDAERKQIKDVGGFTQSATIFNWRSAKGTFATAGLTDAFRDAIGSVADYEDPIEGAEAYVSEYRESGGGGTGRDVGEEDVRRQQKDADAGRRAMAEGCNHAEEKCEHGDPAACEHLQQVCGYSSEEVSDLLGGDVPTEDDTEQTDLVTVGGGEYPEMDVTPETAGALRRSWRGYKGGLGDLREGIEQVEQAVIDARQAMRAINSIREAHGQDELHPDSLHDLLDSLEAMPGSIPEVRTLAHFADADTTPAPRDRDAAAESVMAERSTLERMDRPGDLVEVRSPRRPVPRGAMEGLRDYGLVEELEPDDSGRNGGALLLERPPAEFLDRWDLEVERSADVVYSHPQKDVLIYTDPDRVMVGATEATLTPEEAVRDAENEDAFTLEEGDPSAVVDDTAPEPRDLDDSLTSAMSEGSDLERMDGRQDRPKLSIGTGVVEFPVSVGDFDLRSGGGTTVTYEHPDGAEAKARVDRGPTHTTTWAGLRPAGTPNPGGYERLGTRYDGLEEVRDKLTAAMMDYSAGVEPRTLDADAENIMEMGGTLARRETPDAAESAGWQDAFEVDEGRDIPGYVGEWELVDGAELPTYEGDGVTALVAWGDGHATRNVKLEHGGKVAELERYHISPGAAEDQATDYLLDYLADTTPEEAAEQVDSGKAEMIQSGGQGLDERGPLSQFGATAKDQNTLSDAARGDAGTTDLQDAINALEAASDGYGDRIHLDADMKDHLDDAGLDTEAWTERTSQDVFRYGIDAEDVMDRMELPNDADPEEYKAAIIDFAESEVGA